MSVLAEAVLVILVLLTLPIFVKKRVHGIHARHRIYEYSLIFVIKTINYAKRQLRIALHFYPLLAFIYEECEKYPLKRMVEHVLMVFLVELRNSVVIVSLHTLVNDVKPISARALNVKTEELA